MAEGVTTADVLPGKLKPMTADEVKASAQRILDLRGRPPYTIETGVVVYDRDYVKIPFEHLTEDELRVLSEFVQFWLPFLIEKEKR